MLKEEAIDILFGCIEAHSEEENEALDMAIEALQTPPISQRSMYQAGYRQGREEALEREPSEDGTLEVKVEDATKVGRVLISDDRRRGGLYYPDEYEPQGDLISRAEALMEARPEYLSPEQIGHEEYNKGWSDAISMYWANLNALPAKTQDRPIICPRCGRTFSEAEGREDE